MNNIEKRGEGEISKWRSVPSWSDAVFRKLTTVHIIFARIVGFDKQRNNEKDESVAYYKCAKTCFPNERAQLRNCALIWLLYFNLYFGKLCFNFDNLGYYSTAIRTRKFSRFSCNNDNWSRITTSLYSFLHIFILSLTSTIVKCAISAPKEWCKKYSVKLIVFSMIFLTNARKAIILPMICCLRSILYTRLLSMSISIELACIQNLLYTRKNAQPVQASGLLKTAIFNQCLAAYHIVNSVSLLAKRRVDISTSTWKISCRPTGKVGVFSIFFCHIMDRKNSKNSKFLIYPISTCVCITVHEHGKCFIFIIFHLLSTTILFSIVTPD